MSDRTITVVTGTRAEYGLLASSMSEIEDRTGLKLTVLATGMHLSHQHGYTIDEIRTDGFAVTSTVDMLLESDTGLGMAKSLGLGISGIAESFRGIDPDLVLVLGDRNEAFAAGVAAAHMNIPVAHIHGGDAMQGATIDDSIRHSLTKFAHIHFPATERSKERILQLGEEPWRVTTVGAPGLDDVNDGAYDDGVTTARELGFDPDSPLLLVVQHPLTTQPERAGEQMRQTLDAVTELDGRIAVILPNADAGGKRAIEVIQNHSAADRYRTFSNVPRRQYLGLLDVADVLVGNSSSGIIEAPSFSLPVVDVGPRQDGRERADNVRSVPHETEAIREAVAGALEDPAVRRRAENCVNPYDKGGAATRIVDRLESITIDDDLKRKRTTLS
ncbi:UDP-N-acetylglucosamine 2-epimerase [Natrinema ejinorense]|uniref:UDP-N-acetylglucosamine 2-epimerase (Hydrolyzing) n=1 Tax=Natrinema ejinorense TaxID=373386 RepID=A0A2A5QQ94_9EURY|nr:UDP-N-acetylglucosamine 2-epimerase [Natrinema ejinorense]PCR89010.1 UDP-N-acetylglucosamine 2-epimerase (hydrolyzing) [Natrinema ejinorense]